MKSFMVTLAFILASFYAQACKVYIQLDPNWSCEELEICWGEGTNCSIIIEDDVMTLPTGLDVTFITGNCGGATYFNIFHEDGHLLETVEIDADTEEFEYVTNCTLLPVELVSFRGRVINREIKLNWLLASQENLKEIVIIKNSFEYAAIKNTDETQQAWSWTDDTPASGVNYYQLKFIDYDGTSSFSDIISVEFRSNNIKHFQRSGDTHIFKSDSEGTFDYYVSVFSSNGREVMQRQWQGQKQDELEIIFNDVPGFYIVSMLNAYEMYSFKIVIP